MILPIEQQNDCLEDYKIRYLIVMFILMIQKVSLQKWPSLLCFAIAVKVDSSISPKACFLVCVVP